MDDTVSLGVVIPSYRSGLALWMGIHDLLNWSHDRVGRLLVVLVDDGSPDSPFREGSVQLTSRCRLDVLVNEVNLGQSRATLRGCLHCDTDWVALIEDDLCEWTEVLNQGLKAINRRTDLINVARPRTRPSAGFARRGSQVLLSWLLSVAGVCGISDPTSPLKLVRRVAVERLDRDLWQYAFLEGLQATLAETSREIRLPKLRWTAAGSRYRPFRRFGVFVSLARAIAVSRLRAR